MSFTLSLAPPSDKRVDVCVGEGWEVGWGGGGAADCRADFSCGHVTQVNLHLQKSCEVGGDNSQVAQGW